MITHACVLLDMKAIFVRPVRYFPIYRLRWLFGLMYLSINAKNLLNIRSINSVYLKINFLFSLTI